MSVNSHAEPNQRSPRTVRLGSDKAGDQLLLRIGTSTNLRDWVGRLIGFERKEAVALPTPAGGAVLHHRRMFDMPGPNVSAKVRRAYANERQTQPVPRAVPHECPWQAAT